MKVDKKKDLHLIVLVHGHKGSEFDMRLYKNYISKIFPHSHFMISKVNWKEENQSIMKLGEWLSIEIKDHLNNYSDIGKISFLGHSLGGLVIRAALKNLKTLKDKMQTYISLSCPHLGFEIKDNFFVNVGFKFLRVIKDSIILKELDMADHEDYKETCIYKLSLEEGLDWFKNLVFVNST